MPLTLNPSRKAGFEPLSDALPGVANIGPHPWLEEEIRHE